jgi:phospholipase C
MRTPSGGEGAGVRVTGVRKPTRGRLLVGTALATALLMAGSAWLGAAWAGSSGTVGGGSGPIRSLSAPDPSGFPIQHVVVLVQENHAFDNFFGTYCPVVGSYCPTAVNGIPNGTCVPYDPSNLSAGCARPYPFTTYAPLKRDMTHNWVTSHESYDNGKMDGFYAAEKDGIVPFGYFNGSLIPYYWDLAEEYGLGEDFFSGSLSYSLSNHWDLVSSTAPYAAEHYGQTSANYKPLSKVQKEYLDEANLTETVTDLLANSSVSWKYYDNPLAVNYTTALDNHGSSGPFGFWTPLSSRARSYSNGTIGNFAGRAAFFSDAANGTLPNISWVIPTMKESDHPPQSVAVGQKWVSSVINAVERSPEWNSTAIFLTWDEYGGFYDHVAPPQFGPYGLGFRVPLLVVSPYTPEGYVGNQTESFYSIVHFLEWRWNLGTLGATDGNATLPLDFFDPSATPRPPLIVGSGAKGLAYPAAFQDLGVPNAPTAFVANPGNRSGSVNLTWSPPAGGAPPTGYVLNYTEAGNATNGSIRLPAWPDLYRLSNLSSGTNYTFTLQAYDAAGLSSAVNVSLQAPLPPSLGGLGHDLGALFQVYPGNGIAGAVLGRSRDSATEPSPGPVRRRANAMRPSAAPLRAGALLRGQPLGA